jgi:EAL domain-containing protein (putative c-di-GMP-specific phosphodiesterase class I)
MVTGTDCLVQREKAIRDKVNTLEGLHKTCQLSAIGLSEPILNESRYLARALADVLYHERGSAAHLTALQNAEHAARCAINDAVDILVTFVKSSLTRIAKDYSKYSLATSPFGEQFVATLEAMEQIGDKVVTSRQSRDDRDAIYQELADQETELTLISEFALQLPRIEALAHQIHYDQLDDQLDSSNPENQGAKWIADKLAEALDTPTNGAVLSIAIQPKYKIDPNDSPTCIGAEALTRFSVNGSQISPTTFIPIAEQTGLISQLGLFALGQTLKILKEHQELSSISVNVSALELLDSEYSSKVITMVEAALGQPNNRLELEITESAAINDMESFHHLEKLVRAGIRIAIDDFGTGLTKFEYLAKVNIDVLKIDQSLVRAFNRAPDTYQRLLKAITAVGSQCSLEVIAEGVENAEEVDRLNAEIGLTKFQGWHFGKAVSPDEFFKAHTRFVT